MVSCVASLLKWGAVKLGWLGNVNTPRPEASAFGSLIIGVYLWSGPPGERDKNSFITPALPFALAFAFGLGFTGQFSDVDVAEIDFAVVILQFDLACGIDRLFAIPVVF